MYRRLSGWGQGAESVGWGPAAYAAWSAAEPNRQSLVHLLWRDEARPQVHGVVGGSSRSEPLARMEAVLFLAREPLGTRKLAQLAGLADGTEARTLVRTLNRLYDVEGCAFRAVEVAGGFQLRSREKFAPWLRRLQGSQIEVRLSAPAMETLAVVAYRQPVLRAQIEAIRGVQCGEILRQLMERDLVRIVGRSEELGRPFLYGTTRLFLQVFGLRHLDELPRPDWLRLAQPGRLPTATSQHDLFSQPVASITTGGDPDVKTTFETMIAKEDEVVHTAETELEFHPSPIIAADEDDDFEEEDEDLDDDDDEEDEDYEDEDFEDDEWEEVEDDEDLDEDEDEDWDEDDEDWDDDEDEDWDDDEEEEEEKKGDGDWE